MSIETNLSSRPRPPGTGSTTVAITGGGTGGHVYPALAVAAALRQVAGDSTNVIYIGSRGGMEGQLANKAELPFVPVATGAWRGRGPLARGGSLVMIVVGIAQARAELRRHHASAVFATGGYVSAPVVLAASSLRIPSLIYLPDVEPGLAVRFLSRLARRVAVTSEASLVYFRTKQVRVTGYPLRRELLGAPDRLMARRTLSIGEEERVLLVLGGSRGAHSINAALAAALPDLLRDVTVLHSSGPDDEPWLRTIAEGLSAEPRRRYRLWPFLEEDLPAAMAAADLAVSRAGASTMGEYPFFGLASILVPYPHAGAHQDRNAEYLVSSGAAAKLLDADLGQLLPTVANLLADRNRLDHMRLSARGLSKPDAAQAIARELVSLCSIR